MKRSLKIDKDMVEKVKAINLILLDVDGVLTNGNLTFMSDGSDIKTFHVRDGVGIKLAQNYGIDVGILTGRQSSTVNKRASELGISIIRQGILNKLPVFNEIINEKGTTHKRTAYFGDDIIDLPVLKMAGFSAAPVDAHPWVKEIVTFVGRTKGGEGFVREAIEIILGLQGKMKLIRERYLS